MDHRLFAPRNGLHGARHAAVAAHAFGGLRMQPQPSLFACGLVLAGAASAVLADDPLETLPQPYHGALRALPIAPFASAAASAAQPPERRWDVLTQDITLAHTLERWASAAGYRLKWDAQRNFLIGAPDSVEGSFEAALQTVLGSAGIRESDYPLEACIYANTPPLVRITRQGEQARECAAP
jgi:hypothetical protein